MSTQMSREKSGHLIEELVAVFLANRELIERFRNSLIDAITGSRELTRYIHSVKSRLKDPDHLRDKLRRKIKQCEQAGYEFDINPENILTKVNDLAGVRVLHLHTRQIREIDLGLRNILDEQRYALIEGPFARTWDDESRAFFKDCGISTQESPSLYTSVHYVVGSASRTTITCEIQVRTLMEEVWGEVDHSVNYPHGIDSVPCKEQLKVLARVTSSASRLVDSIFATLDDHRTSRATAPESKPVEKGQQRRARPRNRGKKERRRLSS